MTRLTTECMCGKEVGFFFCPPFISLPNQAQGSCCQQRTVRLRKRQITASLSRDYSNEVIGHWPGNMWPRKQTNEIWFRFRLCLVVSVRKTDKQTWTDFFFFFSISPPAVPAFQSTDIPNIWMLTQQMWNEWHTLWYKWNHVNLLCRFSHFCGSTEGLQPN